MQDQSPGGVYYAVLESDDRAIYLHLVGLDGTKLPTRSLWVRNLQPAPVAFENGWQSAGRGPILPFDFCRTPAGLPPLDDADLNLLWFPEGDAVALRDGDELLAVSPPWAGLDDCPGYARDCTARSPVAWPLGGTVDNPIRQQVEEVFTFWRSWETSDPWPGFQQKLMGAYQASFGEPTQYYAADGGNWPPRFITQHETEQGTVLCTGGMSIRPQPRVVTFYEDPSTVRRIELAIALTPDLSTDISHLLTGLGALTRFPWATWSWLASGHTLQANGVPVGPSGQPFDCYVIHHAPPGITLPTMPQYADEPVHLLWLIPITNAERSLAQHAGTEELMERLFQSNPSPYHSDRETLD
ncbi:MAG: suppressor of fused domain protein [Myxococcota bacterium]|nr:suppressor of fused domain protein [Myxococcota bacterium]